MFIALLTALASFAFCLALAAIVYFIARFTRPRPTIRVGRTCAVVLPVHPVFGEFVLTKKAMEKRCK